MRPEEEEKLLHSVALQNASTILRARQRAEEQLVTAQNALRESEERFRAAFNQAAVGMAEADLSGRFTAVNRKLCETLGYEMEEVLGMTFAQLAHPEDLAATRETLRRLLADEASETSQEKRYLRKDGGIVWSQTAVTLLRDASGQPRRLIGVIVDITQRKAFEEALRLSEQFNRTIIESSRDCIKTLSLDGILTWVSEAAEGPVCIENPAEAVGRSWIEIWRGRHREAAREAVRTAAAGGTGAFVGQLPVKGEARWWDVVVSPIRNPSGEPDSLLAVSRDITDRMAAEDERRQLLESERAARAAAERASQMKDDFLATLSHELRTPLGAILGWAQILRNAGQNGADLMKGLDTIERNARAQTKLIEDLLDMSRITSGKLRLDIQPVEPVSFIEAAVETVKPAAEAKGIRLVKLLDPSTGPIAGDPGRLQQVVWNLLSNAIKFTPRGGRVQVTLQRVNSHVEIVVSDDGAGIDPQFLPHIFERFRQADASSTRQHGGLGLGLSIVKQLSELHGGSVAAASEGLGKGSAFTLALPLTVVKYGREEPRVQPGTERGPGDFARMDLSGVKVLVVDDQPDSRDLVRRVLAECRASVLTAASAAEGLLLVRTERPDVLVTDIGMPDVDGFEFLRRVRALDPPYTTRLPAIALTAFARSEDRTRALRAGFLVHVSKPVEPSELAATVATVAGRAGETG